MRRLRNVVLMALLTAGLAACWLALRTPAPVTDVLPDGKDAPAFTMMYERDAARFRTMSVTLTSGETYAVATDMVYDENGRLLGVRNGLGQPVTVAGQPDFPLDETAWQMMLLAVQHLPSTARYDSLDLDACGLTTPAACLTITYEGEDELCLRIGRATADGASCFVAVEGDRAVYLVPDDFRQIMTRTLSAQHRLPGGIAHTENETAQIAVDGLPCGRIIATRHHEPGRILPWTIDTPIRHAGSTAYISKMISGLCAIHAQAWETTVYDAAGLAAYGLDQPLRLLAAFNDGVIRDIAIGSDAGDGTVYARMDQSGDVYRIGRGQLAFLEEISLDNLADRFVALVPFDTVEQVQVALPGGTLNLELTWGDDPQPICYAMNGQEITQQAFSHRYAALVGMQFDKTAPAEVQPGDPWVDMTYALRDGGTVRATIADYNHDYALALTDGGGRFLIRRSRVEAMMATLKEESR